MELELLRKIPKSKQKAEESIKTAESWFEEAENNLRSKAFRSVYYQVIWRCFTLQGLYFLLMVLKKNLIRKEMCPAP